MPPTRKIKKEDIVNVTYDIVKNEGFKGVNARRIAKELHCSVQPIFHNFESMEELKKVIYDKIYEKYKEYMMSGMDDEGFYKRMGVSYIQFAKDYPLFFQILFMQQTNLNAENFLISDEIGEDIIKAGQTFSHLSYEKQKRFHIRVWLFTHGIACLVATKTIDFQAKEIEDLLKTTVKEMLIGFQEMEEK